MEDAAVVIPLDGAEYVVLTGVGAAIVLGRGAYINLLETSLRGEAIRPVKLRAMLGMALRERDCLNEVIAALEAVEQRLPIEAEAQ